MGGRFKREGNICIPMADSKSLQMVTAAMKLKDAYSLEKTHARRDWGQEEKGTTEDETVGWHHRLNGYEFG